MDNKIAFIGAGNMAEAMVKGLVSSGALLPGSITVSDSSSHRLLHMKKTYGVHAVSGNADAAKGADVIVLSVKPQVMEHALKDIASAVTAKKLVISIAAGVPIARIRKGLGKKARIVRVMPNTPSLVGQGAAAVCYGPDCRAEDRETASRLLSAMCAVVVEVPDEKQMDAVTGLSGSGPAYAFVIMEALADAGVRMGLSRDTAFRLSAQTLLGSARMALETREPLCKLKDMVTSPGGTTIAGLEKLEDGGLRAALYAAVEAATRRSEELGKD